MSHSLHRFGTPEDLKDDFCIYARCAREVNWDAQDKLMKILDIYLSEDFVNFGSSHAGQSYIDGLDTEGCKKSLEHSYGVIMNFAKRSAVEGVLRKLRDEDLGISIVVSGLIDVVVDMARECGLKPHTATLSLGIYGKKSMLPKDDTLKIITMCGHSLISSRLVESVCERVKGSELSPEEAAGIIARSCVCGIFNTRRCAELIHKQLP